MCSFALKADDGYRLWLKFDKVASASRYASYAQSVSSEFPTSPIIETARKELSQGLKGASFTNCMLPSVDFKAGAIPVNPLRP